MLTWQVPGLALVEVGLGDGEGGEAGVGDGSRDALGGQHVGGLQRFLQAGAQRQDGDRRAFADDAALADLAQRIERLHGIDALPDPVADLLKLVRPLELDALREELDLLLQSGELSDAAEARKLELLRLTRDLKLEISQERPISGR